MSGHHPFQRLIDNIPIERKLAIELSGDLEIEVDRSTA
jgi:hypothetical protein